MNSGKAVIFSAPSGAGKTTIVRHLINTLPQLKFSVSATTRSPRSGREKHGIDYYFLSQEEFRLGIEKEKFYEWEEVYPGTFYGTLKEEVERIWAAGNHVIFDVDVIGGLNLKKVLGERALAVFVSVSGIDVLEKRLLERKTDSSESIVQRLAKAKEEMVVGDQFDYILINDELDVALQEAESVVSRFINSDK